MDNLSIAIYAVSVPLAASAANTFEAGVPNARVVRLQHADHYIFLSNEADVLREMTDFLRTLLAIPAANVLDSAF